MVLIGIFSSSLLFIFLCIKKSNLFSYLHEKSRGKADFRVDSNNTIKDLVPSCLFSLFPPFTLRLYPQASHAGPLVVPSFLFMDAKWLQQFQHRLLILYNPEKGEETLLAALTRELGRSQVVSLLQSHD